MKKFLIYAALLILNVFIAYIAMGLAYRAEELAFAMILLGVIAIEIWFLDYKLSNSVNAQLILVKEYESIYDSVDDFNHVITVYNIYRKWYIFTAKSGISYSNVESAELYYSRLLGTSDNTEAPEDNKILKSNYINR
jgi:hypothetical protein